LRPTDRFAEFAVADDVEADIGLFPHDSDDAVGEAALIGVLVVGFPTALGTQEFDQLGRPNQAADMRGQDSLIATLQEKSPCVRKYVAVTFSSAGCGQKKSAPAKADALPVS